jgi:hypothetical protein
MVPHQITVEKVQAMKGPGTCAKQDQGDFILCELQSLNKKEAGQYLGPAGQFTVAMVGTRV